MYPFVKMPSSSLLDRTQSEEASCKTVRPFQTDQQGPLHCSEAFQDGKAAIAHYMQEHVGPQPAVQKSVPPCPGCKKPIKTGETWVRHRQYCGYFGRHDVQATKELLQKIREEELAKNADGFLGGGKEKVNPDTSRVTRSRQKTADTGTKDVFQSGNEANFVQEEVKAERTKRHLANQRKTRMRNRAKQHLNMLPLHISPRMLLWYANKEVYGILLQPRLHEISNTLDIRLVIYTEHTDCRFAPTKTFA